MSNVKSEQSKLSNCQKYIIPGLSFLSLLGSMQMQHSNFHRANTVFFLLSNHILQTESCWKKCCTERQCFWDWCKGTSDLEVHLVLDYFFFYTNEDIEKRLLCGYEKRKLTIRKIIQPLNRFPNAAPVVSKNWHGSDDIWVKINDRNIWHVRGWTRVMLGLGNLSWVQFHYQWVYFRFHRSELKMTIFHCFNNIRRHHNRES